MKSLNRTLSLVLVLVMVLGLFGVAGAAFTDDAKIQYKEAVDVMTGIGAINGMGDGTFAPTGNITRAQAAKLVAYTILGADIAKTLSGVSSSFKDVTVAGGFGWAIPSIEYLVKQGVINGRGDGTFDPNGKITGFELAKMLLSALGYGKTGEFTGSNYELAVAIQANKCGTFTGSKAASNGAAATREEAALYCFNTLTNAKSGQVTYSKLTGEYSDPKTTIGDDVYGIKDASIKASAMITGVTKNAKGEVLVSLDNAPTALVYTPDLAQYGHTFKIYTDGAAKVYAVVDLSTTYTVPATVATVAALNKALGYTPALVSATAVPTFTNYAYSTVDYNAGANTALADGDVAALAGKTIVLTNNVITAVVNPVSYTINKVKEISTTAGAETITIGTNTVLANNKTSDVVNEYAGIAKDDIVTVTKINNITTLTKVKTVEGTISKISGTTYTMGGVDYKLSTVTDNSGIVDDTANFKDTFVLYLDLAGSYVACVKKAGTPSVASDIVFVTTVYTNSSTDAYGTTTTSYFAETVALDGTVDKVLIGVGDNAGVKTLTAGLYTFKTSSVDAAAKLGVKTATEVTAGTANGANITGAVKQVKAAFENDVTFSATTSSIAAGDITTVAQKAYVTSNTKFVFITGDKATLKVEVKNAPISYALTAAEGTMILSKDAQGNLIVDAVVVKDTYTDPGTTSTDYLFVASAQSAPAQTAKGYEYTVYTAAGAKQTITATNSTVAAVGFYSYTVVDGVYTLANVATGTLVEQTFTSRFGTKITSTSFTDAEAGSAVIVDVDATTGDALTSVTQFAGTTKFFALGSNEKGISVIFVTDRA